MLLWTLLSIPKKIVDYLPQDPAKTLLGIYPNHTDTHSYHEKHFFEEENSKIELYFQITHLQGCVYFYIEILQELDLDNSLILHELILFSTWLYSEVQSFETQA